MKFEKCVNQIVKYKRIQKRISSPRKEKKFTFAKNSTMNYIEKYRPLIIALGISKCSLILGNLILNNVYGDSSRS